MAIVTAKMAHQSFVMEEVLFNCYAYLRRPPTMAKYLARSCPMCGQYMGVAIADEIGKRRRIHGLCSTCGYEIDWTLLRS